MYTITYISPVLQAVSSDSAEEISILLNQMVLTGCDPCTPNMPYWCENVSVDCQACFIGCPLSKRSCGYFKLWSRARWRREPAWKRQLADLDPAPATDVLPCTPNMPHWRENVSVDCQTCLIGCPLSRRSQGYFKLWSGVRWRREPAWKRQLAVLVPSPTTDLGLADPFLSLFEVFYPDFSAVQLKGL